MILNICIVRGRQGKGITMRNNRKIILINKPFQLRVVGYFIGLALINITIFYACIYYFFWNLRHTGLTAGLKPNHVFFLFVDEQSYIMTMIFVAVAVFTVSFLLIIGLLISHKIAGPLYHLKKHIDECEEKGELSPIRFRKGDFFLEVQDAFNRLANSKKNK